MLAQEAEGVHVALVDDPPHLLVDQLARALRGGARRAGEEDGLLLRPRQHRDLADARRVAPAADHHARADPRHLLEVPLGARRDAP